MNIDEIKSSRAEEYKTIAAKRFELLTAIEGLDEFSTKEHYTESFRHLVKESGGKISLSRIQLVHPDRSLVNEVRKQLQKAGEIESIKVDQAVIIQFKAKVPDTSAAEPKAA